MTYDKYIPSNYNNLDNIPNKKFDLVIIKGAFNYLTDTEIKLILTKIKPKGKLIFNTFLTPPEERKRNLENKLGDIGEEKSLLVDDKIIHQWKIGSKIINHWFYFRSIDWILDNFSNYKIDQNKNIFIVNL
jgi:hypothetical protein